MKMYEKLGMSTEDALKWIYECKYRKCIDCKAHPSMTGEVSSRCAAGYLLSEVPELPKIPRWQTAQTQDDFDRLFAEFDNYCEHTFQCKKCRLNGTPDKGRCDCYHAYLSELVDVPESEVDND